MANLPLTEIVVPGSEDVLELAPDLTDEVTALQDAVSTLNTDVSNIPNGTYPNLTAGSILTDKYDIDTTPYLYRAVPYVSKRLEESLVGGSVVWNQLVQNGNFVNANNWLPVYGTTSVSNNELKYKATSIGGAYYENQVYQVGINVPSGHVIFYSADMYALYNNDLMFSVRNNQAGIGAAKRITGVANQWNTVANVKKISQPMTDIAFYWYMNTNYQVGDEVKLRNVVLVDLTQMLGSTIADYVATLESGTAGAGVAWLKARGFFTKPYYNYDTGTIKSVEATAHVTMGVNAWDEEWELGTIDATGTPTASSATIRSKNYIQIIPNTTYYCKGEKTFFLHFYDADKNWISSTSKYNETFTTPVNAYYMKFRLSSGTSYNNDMCINISDPTINGKYFPYEEHTYQLGDVVLRGIPKLVNNELVYDGDVYKYDGAVQRNTIFRAYQAGDESLANAITDGTNTVLYSANASTETTAPFEQYQVCETGGTEEYTTTNDVPVGHETKYFTDIIGNIENIPAPPTTNGTYTLQVTVSASGNTYAWV